MTNLVERVERARVHASTIKSLPMMKKAAAIESVMDELFEILGDMAAAIANQGEGVNNGE